jgi:NADPH-dependent glutamate synthase beta subunit-like oxidoreductase
LIDATFKNFTFVKFISVSITSNRRRADLTTTKNAALREVFIEYPDAEKLKFCFECGICTASCPMAELLKGEYNPRNLLERIFLNIEDVLASDELWLCAWCYRCYRHCPQALKPPEIFHYVRKLAVKQGYKSIFKNAVRKIVEVSPLPLVTMLTCFHPERAGLDLNEALNEAEALRKELLDEKKRRIGVEPAKGKVAVIGSGPAGLSVAHELAIKNYRVTVFEAFPEPGGMLRKCLPVYRLPREFLDKDIRMLEDLGVEIETGVAVGKDIKFNSLWDGGYNAIFIGAGAHKGQELRINGVELKGVVHALDFLQMINYGKEIDVGGRRVIVIGGGNVAVDAARMAIKYGVDEATIFYRRSREEMPANPWEVKEAESEGVKMEFLASPKRILGVNGEVSAVEFVRMKLGELDETGRRKPIPIEGSEFVKEADMVVLAIGEAPDLSFLPKEIELNEDGTVWVNPLTMETTLKGVFAGGDAVTGPASIIEAICAGKIAASSIEYYLKSLGLG